VICANGTHWAVTVCPGHGCRRSYRLTDCWGLECDGSSACRPDGRESHMRRGGRQSHREPMLYRCGFRPAGRDGGLVLLRSKCDASLLLSLVCSSCRLLRGGLHPVLSR